MNIAIVGLGRVYQHYKVNFIEEIIQENKIFLFDSNERVLKKEQRLEPYVL